MYPIKHSLYLYSQSGRVAEELPIPAQKHTGKRWGVSLGSQPRDWGEGLPAAAQSSLLFLQDSGLAGRLSAESGRLTGQQGSEGSTGSYTYVLAFPGVNENSYYEQGEFFFLANIKFSNMASV